MRISSLFPCIFYIPFLYPSTAAATRRSHWGRRSPLLYTTSDITTPTTSQSATTSSSSVVVPSQSSPTLSLKNPSTTQEIALVTGRRLANIVGSLTGAAPSVPVWLSTLQSNGQWPDVDYTSGCLAQRANWPAEGHWNRISTMAAAWRGGLDGAEQYANDAGLRNNLSIAMGYWFTNDFTNVACLTAGGTDACPCDTPGLWNTNWFPGVIGVPELVSKTCLLLDDTLLKAELYHCTVITGRAYKTFDSGAGFLAGANNLDIAKIGIDQALLTKDVSLLTDAYRRVHIELLVATADRADGIRPDGSFAQHAGILYNGNYGKDYTNDAVDLEVEAAGTQFGATSLYRDALTTLFDGDRWMIYRNVLTGVLHWDFSVLGRFIAFPRNDFFQSVMKTDHQVFLTYFVRATSSIHLNLAKIENLGREWNSTALQDFSSSLSNGRTVNAGQLEGNRMFYNSDYMVHRGSQYVTTLKMYSTRTTNTECTNSANPFGFHLSDGALRTYLQGDEYEDIAAAMVRTLPNILTCLDTWQNWNLIPGTTVDYGETSLNCKHTKAQGIEDFVGGASDGKLGVAAMRYTNPLTNKLHWQKTWFFLANGLQLVMVANISSATNATIISVLDQRRHNGNVILNGSKVFSASSFGQHGHRAQTLWHGNVGYSFSSPGNDFSLSIEVGRKTSNWPALGTSAQVTEPVDLFSAWIVHESPNNTSLAYTVFPGVDLNTFEEKNSQSQVQIVQNDALISAALDQSSTSLMAVFWATGGGSVDVAPKSPQAFRMSANGTAALIFDWTSGKLTVSDPTQTLTAVSITLSVGRGMASRLNGLSKTFVFILPSRGFSGSSVSQNVYH
ncbi:polysaccharide lyase family 8 protein [Mycena belliarum]|uniref:Polysaccharide lyase family 8 protein n=1 Tax=Mycena belliarum TaxID=1033014 RepID=A0AAD6UIC6_9AGAR|nr:polysaccharide lyase family 8 protein [Mycena belliae]